MVVVVTPEPEILRLTCQFLVQEGGPTLSDLLGAQNPPSQKQAGRDPPPKSSG